MTKCAVCLASFGTGDYAALARHLAERAGDSDSGHVRWLNQNVTRTKTGPPDLVPALRRVYDLGAGTVKDWIKAKFIAKF